MRCVGWVVVLLALTGCAGKSLNDGGSAGSAGQAAGGAPAQGGSAPVSGASSVSGSSSTGGAAPIDNCITSGAAVPATPVRFQFESVQGLWLQLGCTLQYTVAKLCKDTPTPIMTQAFCSQECSSSNTGCSTCGACPFGTALLGQGNVQIVDWDGFVYTYQDSSNGCTCYTRRPATAGTYQVSLTAYLSSEDALAGRNGYNFSTSFTYPAPDVVHVSVDFQGL